MNIFLESKLPEREVYNTYKYDDKSIVELVNDTRKEVLAILEDCLERVQRTKRPFKEINLDVLDMDCFIMNDIKLGMFKDEVKARRKRSYLEACDTEDAIKILTIDVGAAKEDLLSNCKSWSDIKDYILDFKQRSLECLDLLELYPSEVMYNYLHLHLIADLNLLEQKIKLITKVL